MKIIYLFLFVFFCSSNLKAQSIENVDFIYTDEYIKVTYDLTNCPDGKVYDINLTFEKKDGGILNASSLKGDLKRVKPGLGKEIFWYFKTDVDEYIGELKAMVSILSSDDLDNSSNIQSDNKVSQASGNFDSNNYNFSGPKVLGGPGNAFLSMLLPGFGDHFVNEKDKVTPYFVSLAFLASGYMAYTTMNAANDYYDQYLNTRSQAVMDETYAKAIENRNQHQIFFGVASAIWLFDVLHVTVKGSKNIKKTKSIAGIKLIPKYNQYRKSNPFEFALVKTF